ncbi:restriction endonuclease [Streptomyces antimycoticus]|uniref:restriction endonuclease n=1 Tax=Streptomyces antimycoticus TaxID=68175 RepID=UPI0033E28AF3
MTSTPKPAQPISPAAYGALAGALKSIFWYKRDLERFIRLWATDHPSLLAHMDFSGYKWATADEFVDRLMADERQYRDLSLRMMAEVSHLTSFPALKRHESAESLIAEAREAVDHLRGLVDRQRVAHEQQSQFDDELLTYRAVVEAQHGFEAKLAALKERFLELERMDNRQKAGRLFEPFLNDVFRLFDMEPRLSYSLEYEQIDGSLTFDTDDYIVEAKWWREAIQPHHLYSFNEKVRRKGKNSLGIFISVNGFTSGAREAYRESTPFLTIEGLDFFYVLDGRLTLDELLRRKKRHANETGSCYFPATMFPGE